MPRNSDLNAMSRQWEMLKLLPAKPPGMTSRDLQEQLHNMGYNVVKRTIERDLLDLSKPFPILCNDKGKPYGWYWDPGASANLPAITLAEALPLLPPSIDAEVLDLVQQALLYDQQIEVDYETAHVGNLSRQTLHPLALVQRGPITYTLSGHIFGF